VEKVKIGVVSRFDLPEAIKLTKKVLGWLPGAEVVLAPGVARELDEKGVSVADMKVDALVTIGGDGTVLYVQQRAPDTPVLGINMGGTGFLTDVDPKDAQKALKALIGGELQLKERAKLAVEVSGERLPDALNEAVVRVASPSRMLTFEVLVDGEVTEGARGDGVIVATPTGSTAYNMAAGGPVLDPRLEAFIMTPLYTHQPRATSLVLPMSSTIEVKLLRPERKAQVTIDGQFTREASSKDRILFHRSENPAKFFEWGSKFYQKVKEKL
jgi:NAD+ kinase